MGFWITSVDGASLRKNRLEILHVPVEATGFLGVEGNQDLPNQYDVEYLTEQSPSCYKEV